ncbi:cortex morphogenetic protein CmpA [Paenibacillus radicibacter]|uniref:cortex morphogenetic protein CmpA n=1 Tax=Paenibacillus radicibacter TaxID=2972488 RepID=UPI00358FAF80
MAQYMPQWLCNQLMRAYSTKNRKQIRMLNESWFFYRSKLQADKESENTKSK